MEVEETKNESGFRRKVYTKMYNSSMSQIKADCEKPQKKIVPTSKKLGMREEFKKTFLPLLIDVFELRQMIQNAKAANASSLLKSLGKKPLTPEHILEKLENLQEDITESKRWMEGVIAQIDKGITEAKEALENVHEQAMPTEPSSFPHEVKIELDELLDQKYSPGRLFNKLFKRRKKNDSNN